jgi:hypothetical protein
MRLSVKRVEYANILWSNSAIQEKKQSINKFVLFSVFQTLFYTLPRLACLNDEEWIHPDMFLRADPSWKDGSERVMPLYNKSQKLAACEPGPWKMKATGTETRICRIFCVQFA